MTYTIYKIVRHGKYEPYIYIGDTDMVIKYIRSYKLTPKRDDAKNRILLSDKTYIEYEDKKKVQIARDLIRLMRIPK